MTETAAVTALRHYFWPAVGLLAVAFSGWLLVHEIRGLTVEQVVDGLAAIPPGRWGLAALAAVLAYAAIAEYDRIALIHLNRRISFFFVMATSFTTYALAHNIGATLVSGTVVRLRAYGSRGLAPAEIGVLVALTSFTFALGCLILGGAIMLAKPRLLARLIDVPDWTVIAAAVPILGFVVFYAAGSLIGLEPLRIGRFHLEYPRPQVVLHQLVVGPLDLIGAAAIIYFCLPEAGNPGFVAVLGIFIASFAVALISHAPGGLGVIEFGFLTALDDMDEADVIAALIVFRLFYLLIPLALAIVAVLLFERAQLARPRT